MSIFWIIIRVLQTKTGTRRSWFFYGINKEKRKVRRVPVLTYGTLFKWLLNCILRIFLLMITLKDTTKEYVPFTQMVPVNCIFFHLFYMAWVYLMVTNIMLYFKMLTITKYCNWNTATNYCSVVKNLFYKYFKFSIISFISIISYYDYKNEEKSILSPQNVLANLMNIVMLWVFVSVLSKMWRESNFKILYF